MKNYRITLQDERGAVTELYTPTPTQYATPIEYGADDTQPDGIKRWRVIDCQYIGTNDRPTVSRVYWLHGAPRSYVAVMSNGDSVDLCREALEAIADGANPSADTIATRQARKIRDTITHEDKAAERQKTNDENRDTCKRIAKKLEAYARGEFVRCPTCGECYHRDELDEASDEDENAATCPHCMHCDERDQFEPVTLYEYLANALDIDYTINSTGELKSCRVCVGLGGPNIYIDTARRAVCLYWWSDRAEYPIDCADDVEEVARELWEGLRA